MLFLVPIFFVIRLFMIFLIVMTFFAFVVLMALLVAFLSCWSLGKKKKSIKHSSLYFSGSELSWNEAERSEAYLCLHAIRVPPRSYPFHRPSSTLRVFLMQQLPNHRSYNEHWLQSLHNTKNQIRALFSTAFSSLSLPIFYILKRSSFTVQWNSRKTKYGKLQ